MDKILVIANGPAYGSEALFNALRLSIAIKEQKPKSELKLFLMSDAVMAGIKGQKPLEGYNIQQMLEILIEQKTTIVLCKTCADGRGISSLTLIDGVRIGTLIELANWAIEADKVISF